MVAPPEFVDRLIELCRQAAQASWKSAGRDGNLVELSGRDGQDLMICGDLHGQRLNFNSLLDVADLDSHPRRHLVMQEVCHGGPSYPLGCACMSHLLLEDVVRLKVRYGDRFHFLLSNHEMAELTEFPIAKGHQVLNLLFRAGVEQQYGDRTNEVLSAYGEFLRSCPLALLVNRHLLVSHSAPDAVDRKGFDTSVFHRELTVSDMLPEGAAFRLVWGRDYRRRNAEAFASMLRVDVMIHGHDPCRNGYNVPNEFQVILDSCCSTPCYVILPLEQRLRQNEIVARIAPLP